MCEENPTNVSESSCHRIIGQPLQGQTKHALRAGDNNKSGMGLFSIQTRFSSKSISDEIITSDKINICMSDVHDV